MSVNANELVGRQSGDVTGVAVNANELVGRQSGDVTGVAISASQVVGRSASGDIRGLSAGTARQTLLLGTASPKNERILMWSSASSQFVQKGGFPNVTTAVTATDAELNSVVGVSKAMDTPTSSTNPNLGFGTWRTPNNNRATVVQGYLRVGTDGSTNGRIVIDIDESGGTTADYNRIQEADAGFGSGAIEAIYSVIIPPGASYQYKNGQDPNNVNDAVNPREFTL